MAEVKKGPYESLISSSNRVEVPFIRIDINGYTFGVYEESIKGIGPNGLWRRIGVKYPNYVKSLEVTKINGTVNQYTLRIEYPITQYDDPNFFEKLFSSVSDTRKIKFSYGDFMVPDYTFRDEEAIITKVTTSPGISEAKITYTVTAVSDTVLANASKHTFPATTDKPSNVLKYYIFNEKYHIQDLFPGMKDPGLVEQLIANNDKIVYIEPQNNVSTMEYFSYLISNMTPVGTPDNTVKQKSIYSLSIHEDNTGTYGGTYFKVQQIQSDSTSLAGICSYEIDIGYPSSNYVTSFSINSDDDWSIYYNYNKSISSTDYVKRLNSKGELEYVYTPQLTNGSYTLENTDKTWWTRVTEFPVEATMTIRGLLKPATLMNYVKINVWYWGRKYMLSGYYLISGQKDSISESGYRTTLNLIRVAPDDDIFPYSGGKSTVSNNQPDSSFENSSSASLGQQNKTIQTVKREESVNLPGSGKTTSNQESTWKFSQGDGFGSSTGKSW